jgi:hypothetical protein
VAPVFRFPAPRLPNPFTVERCGAASAPGIPRTCYATNASILLIYFQGTPLHERVAFECGSLRQFYEQVRGGASHVHAPMSRHTCTMQLFPALSDAYPVHYPAALCTWEVFLWLRCLFDSRAFHLKALDGSLMPSLLPGADMFNYRFSLLSLRLSHPPPPP